MPTVDHAFFGRVVLASADEIDQFGDLCDLNAIPFRGTLLPATLYYDVQALADFRAKSLDPLALLAVRLEELDAVVRASFPDDLRISWLKDRADPSMWGDETVADAAAKALHDRFAGTPLLKVASEPFAAALSLRKVSFSLAVDGSGGASLTLDYRILPDEVDNYLFAAKFAEDGRLLAIDMES